MRRSALLLVAALGLTGALSGVSNADVFEGTSLLSSSPSEQATYAHDPAVSGDGRWVVFDGEFAGQLGVWRRAVAGGPIEAVAVGAPGTPAGSAVLPSVSFDGRFVSFTSTAQLDPAHDTNRAPDVYVRDMQAPSAEPCGAPSEEEALVGESPLCAYTLVSAKDGSNEGLTYSYANRGFEEAFYGALAAGRSAISADGSEVAFVTTAASDLDGTGTPSLQVALRDLSTRTTRLVSVRIDPSTGLPQINPQTGRPEPVSAAEGPETYGALFTGSGGHAPRFGPTQPREAATPIGAALSADGSTVAWMATDITAQAPTLASEDLPAKYSEPLWRRVGDGELAPTRRITGGSDPESPVCIASGELAVSIPALPTDPCQGPFATRANAATPGVVGSLEGNDDVIPRLSADGYEVAFLANAPLVTLGEGFGNGANGHTDIYLASMKPGLTRTQALTPLSELAGGALTDLATTAPIIDLGISADGTQVAFTTKRTQFTLGSPAYISPPAPGAGMLELFDADLSNSTLTRVSEGFEGSPSARPHPPVGSGGDPYSAAGDGALSPSFSADGNLLVFGSTAANLVYGDGNSPPASEPTSVFDGSDVFARRRVVFGSTAAASYVGAAPAAPLPTPLWQLGVTAATRRDGSVLISALVPGAGTLRVSAAGVVPARLVAQPSKAARRAALPRGLRSAAVARREVHPAQPGLISVSLRLSPRFVSLAARRGGLTATLTATFVAADHPPLRERFEIAFRRSAAARGVRHG